MTLKEKAELLQDYIGVSFELTAEGIEATIPADDYIGIVDETWIETQLAIALNIENERLTKLISWYVDNFPCFVRYDGKYRIDSPDVDDWFNTADELEMFLVNEYIETYKYGTLSDFYESNVFPFRVYDDISGENVTDEFPKLHSEGWEITEAEFNKDHLDIYIAI